MSFQVELSKEISTAESIRKHAGTSHGYGLIALSMIDNGSSGLTISATFPSISSMNDAAEQMLKSVLSNKAIRTQLNRVESNGRIMSKFLDYAVNEKGNSSPKAPSDFKGALVLINVEVSEDSQEWNFYKLPEQCPRVLKLLVGG